MAVPVVSDPMESFLPRMDFAAVHMHRELILNRKCQESGVFYLQQQENTTSNNGGVTTTKGTTQQYNEIDKSLKRNNNLEMITKIIYCHMFNTNAHNPSKLYREPVAE